MSSALFSPSRAAMAAHCQGAARLPRCGNVSPEALAGTERHRFLQLVHDRMMCGVSPEDSRAAVLGEFVADRQNELRTIALDVIRLYDAAGRPTAAELPLAYDPWANSCRVLERDKKPRVQCTEHEIPLVVDLGSMPTAVNGGRALGLNYKTGGGWADGPEESWQAKIEALAIAALTGADEVESVIAKLGADHQWIELRDVRNRAHLLSDRLQLQDVCARWIEAGKRDPANASDLVHGDHCRWCPSVRFCPANVQWVAATMADIAQFVQAGGLAGMDAFATTPEARGALWAMAKRAQEVGRELLQRLEPVAYAGAVAGVMVVSQEETAIDAARALPILRELGLELPDGTLAKGKIEEACRGAPRGTRKRIMDALGEAGAIRRSLVERLEMAK